MALNLVVAAAGSIVIVNTVNYVLDELGGSQTDVSWMFAASGGGTLLTALILPRVLNHVAERTVMVTGAVVLVAGTAGALVLTATGAATYLGTALVWAVIGGGMALIVTSTGRVLRASVEPNRIPEVFAAQFSISHLAWLLTYPIAGWIGTSLGFTTTWSIPAGLTVLGAVTAVVLWRPDTDESEAPARRRRLSPEPQNLAEAEAAQGTLAACLCSSTRTA